MALYIRDDEVDVLAKQVQKVISAPSKTEAVRIALQHELERAREAVPLRERIRRLQEEVKALGPYDRDLDLKEYMDEMWGDI
ncbi:type II toxin-antitoxin system VapB family antitoxin [Chelativorans xinjiangense]|uniref:type II toxin-antitoxin system VapB family antitoxin n=1 Tax=Chelativorans xinjiangense TaxID=2681485 RepID=UPI00135B5610|nr:type II toxin-antitoxin system VapB family antitoxin [Chelativorans xinjiangense]